MIEMATPGGLFYIRSLIASTNPVYGPYAYGLSGFSEVHDSFNGGPGDIGIHGTDDPLFPIAHGHALASEIPDARLLLLARTGHELPEVVWDVVVPAILEHTAGSSAQVANPLPRIPDAQDP